MSVYDLETKDVLALNTTILLKFCWNIEKENWLAYVFLSPKFKKKLCVLVF